MIALAATFISEHYGDPQLLYALLIGLAFHFLNSHPRAVKGINFCGRTVLRVGVVLLGARITSSQVAQLGVIVLLVQIGAVSWKSLCKISTKRSSSDASICGYSGRS